MIVLPRDFGRPLRALAPVQAIRSGSLRLSAPATRASDPFGAAAPPGMAFRGTALGAWHLVRRPIAL